MTVAPLLDVFTITFNEEELLGYCLESYCLIADLLGVVSLVDNGSTDDTLDIIESYRDRLPITLQYHHGDSHHGAMRTQALERCHSPYILYLDSDETFDLTMRDYLLGGKFATYGITYIFKYTTFGDRYHYVVGGNGHTQRLFRNDPGVHFPQEIHTEPQSPQGWGSADWLHDWNSPLLFDHTACKSREALWAKGARYQWAAEIGVPAIGPLHEYIGRVDQTKPETVKKFPPEICARIFTGPV